jgi:hypothetical protein
MVHDEAPRCRAGMTTFWGSPDDDGEYSLKEICIGAILALVIVSVVVGLVVWWT